MSVESILAQAESIAYFLDTRFKIPGTNIRFGYDALIGLLPGLGDTVTSVVGLYVLLLARQAGVRRSVLVKMAVNIGVDWLIGLIPLIDLIFDVAFKANVRNVNLLREELARMGY